ncbi:MAG: hypothetical protein Q9172_001635 [Xanthocarpia lactea]
MTLRYAVPLLALIVSVQSAVFDNTNQGWCYFCSDDGAPPLCNEHCEGAIAELCAKDLRTGWTDIKRDCEISYFPPIGLGVAPDATTCINSFQGILNKCGKDAGDDKPYDNDYCTNSGGGGTYGWNDDGSVMTGTGRYVITTKSTNQCGQNEAPWHLATDIIQWNDSWISPDDQVIYDTNPPDLPDFPEPPPPNPLCETVECDIFDKPYFVKQGKPSWTEKEGYMRHQVRWQGWSDDPAGTEFHKALKQRCLVEDLYNWQVYTEGDDHVADFELPAGPHDKCWCIADAIFDASGGIKVERTTWCDDDGVVGTFEAAPEFNIIHGDETGECPVNADGSAPGECPAPVNKKRSPEVEVLRRRHLEEIGPLFSKVGLVLPPSPGNPSKDIVY